MGDEGLGQWGKVTVTPNFTKVVCIDYYRMLGCALRIASQGVGADTHKSGARGVYQAVIPLFITSDVNALL